MSSGSTHSYLLHIKVGKYNKYASLNIDSKPSATWDDISSCIDVRILFERVQRQSISLGVLVSIEAHDEFDFRVIWWF